MILRDAILANIHVSTFYLDCMSFHVIHLLIILGNMLPTKLVEQIFKKVHVNRGTPTHITSGFLDISYEKQKYKKYYLGQQIT